MGSLSAGLLNHARLRPSEVEHRPEEGLVTMPLRRYPILPGGLFRTRRARVAVPSRLTIRRVKEFRPEDRGQCEEITVLFGLSITEGEVYLGSVEEDRGITCFEFRVRVDGFDVELEDDEPS